MTYITVIDAVGAVLGLTYFFLEYKASIWLWPVCILMYAMDLWLYFDRGLYAKFGIALFSLSLVVYGWTRWGQRRKAKNDAQPSGKLPITHVKPDVAVACIGGLIVAWSVLFYLLSTFTDSRVPLLDSLAGALSIVALWMLSQKYVEQWFVWLVADVLYSGLCFYKGAPFHGCLYAFYVAMIIPGYKKWRRLMREQ